MSVRVRVVLLVLLTISWSALCQQNRTAQRGGGVKIGTGKPRETAIKLGEKAREVSTIKIGTGAKSRELPVATPPPRETTTEETTRPSRHVEVQEVEGKRPLRVGVVVPWRSFGAREYMKAFNSATSSLERKRLGLFKKHQIQAEFDLKVITPSPTGLADLLPSQQLGLSETKQPKSLE